MDWISNLSPDKGHYDPYKALVGYINLDGRRLKVEVLHLKRESTDGKDFVPFNGPTLSPSQNERILNFLAFLPQVSGSALLYQRSLHFFNGDSPKGPLSEIKPLEGANFSKLTEDEKALLESKKLGALADLVNYVALGGRFPASHKNKVQLKNKPAEEDVSISEAPNSQKPSPDSQEASPKLEEANENGDATRNLTRSSSERSLRSPSPSPQARRVQESTLRKDKRKPPLTAAPNAIPEVPITSHSRGAPTTIPLTPQGPIQTKDAHREENSATPLPSSDETKKERAETRRGNPAASSSSAASQNRYLAAKEALKNAKSAEDIERMSKDLKAALFEAIDLLLKSDLINRQEPTYVTDRLGLIIDHKHALLLILNTLSAKQRRSK